jgi:hypothetical protein
MTDEAPKQKLVNGKPVEEDPDATTGDELDQGSSDVSGEGNAGHSEEPDGAGSLPTSGGEIKNRAKNLVERVKKDGPEPVREAAKGLVDRAFDTVDAAFDKWFGKKE